jgi:ribosomal protein L37AE/L43A
MSEDNLQRCPKCGKGRMRRTGRAVTQRENQEPFRDRNYARNYICDNCGHHMSDGENTGYVEVRDSTSATVDEADKGESCVNSLVMGF